MAAGQLFRKLESTWQLQSDIFKDDAQDPEVTKNILVNATIRDKDLLGRLERRISS